MPQLKKGATSATPRQWLVNDMADPAWNRTRVPHVEISESSSYRFIAGCEFDVASGELRRGGTITRLEPQPASVLALLAGRAGDVVTHEEIRRGIWGDDTHVNFQDSMHYCVRQIRAALGDRARDPRFIETIPRRGYRLRADAHSSGRYRQCHVVWLSESN